ncbi:MAG TPA: VWA domain-containing protein [Terriglobia bacterium]|nr:VWA domain-containing protein [Terriglobia bacterium]
MPLRVFKPLACVLVLLLGSTVPYRPQGAPAPSKQAPTAQTKSLVKLWVLAEGHGRKLVLDLTASDFQLSVDGQPQRVAYFAERSPEPLALGVLIENSLNRTYEPETSDWRPYLSLLRKLLRPGDKAFVASFGEKAQLRGEFTNELPKLDRALQDVFTGKPPDDNPALYDSIVTLCAERFQGEPGHRALLVVSDSADSGSYHSQFQTLEAIERNGITVFTLLPWVDRDGQPPVGDLRFARFFANETGGQFFMAFDHKALGKDLDGVAAALAYTYTLGFVPSSGVRDGRYHSVHVKCSRAGVRLYASKGYYTPGR